MKFLLTFFLLPCLVFGQTDSSSPFSIGEVLNLKSSILSENRTLNVYLPYGYGEDSSRSYPVIYLLDGSANEDFIHIAGLVQFGNFPWVALLPPSILVGIANTDRKRDFTYPTKIEKDKQSFPSQGGSAAFIQYLEQEVQPLIEQTYQTTSTKTLIGQSLGGLLGTEILLKHPQLFTHYIIVSPSLWWDNESLLTADIGWLTQSQENPVGVYLAVGKEGEIMERDTKQLADLLEAGNGQSLHLHFDYLKELNHGNILHQAVYRAFDHLFGKSD
ncbi:MAG: alpha/beta hydrolase-fold protein [Bacteroidota bacterium]